MTLVSSTAPPLAAEIDLLRQTDAMDAFANARQRRQVSLRDVCELAKITRNSAQAWMRGDRSPSMAKFHALARAHGYEVVLIDDRGEAVGFDDQKSCIERINRARRAAGVGLYEMEYRSGVSIRSFFAWRNGERTPTLVNIVALAMTFGAKVVMRRMA